MKLNRLTAGLLVTVLALGVACGDDDENNDSNNNNVTTNNVTTNNTTANNTTPNNTTANNTTPNNTTPNNTTPNNTTPNNTTPNNTTPNNNNGATARLQVIHNSPDPGAATVDVYVNDDIFLDDFAFRTGTGFVEVPAGVDLVVDVAPPDSTSSADRINPEGAFTYNLAADSYTTLVASGVLDPSQFAANPDQNDTAFNLLVIGDQKTAPADNSTIEVKVVHGAPDAPAVDAVTADGTAIVDDAAYGDVTDYLPVPGAGVVTLDITTADQSTRVASYQTTGGVQGVTAVALASGFLSPDDNQSGEAFGLFVFLGTDADDATATAGIPLPEAARVQLAHNAADPGAASVDIFINGALAVNDFAFRTATPFITLPSGAGNVEVDVAGPNAGTNIGDALTPADSLFNASPEFGPGSTTTVFANGVITPADFEGDANTIAFNLYPVAAQEAVETAGNFEFKIFHGATDAPAVDVVAGGSIDLALNLMYGMATPDFASLTPDTDVVVDINAAGGATVASYEVNVATLGVGGVTGIIAASGFLTPDNDQNGPAFEPVFFPAAGGAGAIIPAAP